MGRPKMTPEEFWRKVNKNGPLPDAAKYPNLTEPCWIWTKAKSNNGYGVTSFDWKQTPTHRAAWVLTNGQIPDGLCVLHKCDNPPCCNPSHLFLGTPADNAADMVAKKRQSKGIEHSDAITPRRLRGEESPTCILTEESVTEMRKLYLQDGLSSREIAKRFGIADSHVFRIVKGECWKHIPLPECTYTESRRFSKLTPETVREIRALRTTGMPVNEIAHKFGLSIYTTNDIVYRRTWKDLS